MCVTGRHLRRDGDDEDAAADDDEEDDDNYEQTMKMTRRMRKTGKKMGEGEDENDNEVKLKERKDDNGGTTEIRR